jgi:hypothetical protein
VIPEALAAGLPWIGATALAVANLPTIRNTWRGTESNNAVTWVIWAVLAIVLLVAQLNMGGWTPAAILAVPALGVALGISAGAIRHYREAEAADPLLRRVNIICACGAAVSLLVLLMVADEAAVVLTIVTDAIAAVPTIAQAWRPKPDMQVPTTPFVSVSFAGLCALLAAPRELWQVIYPAWMLALGVGMTAIIVARRRTAPPVIELERPAPTRGDPDLLGDATTEDAVWMRSPFGPRLARMIPRDLFVLDVVPAHRFLRMVEEIYATGHREGWEACAARLKATRRPEPPSPWRNGWPHPPARQPAQRR